MAFAFRHQPLKGLYMLSSVLALVFFRLPYWAFISLIPSFRPIPTWSFGRSIILHVFQAYVNILFSTAIESPARPNENDPDAARKGLVWIDPSSDLIVGDIRNLAKANNVEAVRTPGYWYGPRGSNGVAGQKAKPGEKVVYHFHGGAYIMGSAASSDAMMKCCFGGFLEHFPQNPRIFGLEYRLSTAEPFGKSNPFPAALIDAIVGYRYLVQDIGFEPKNILLSGDSAGGNLAFTLAYYLSTYKLPELPQAGGMLLISPTVDWAVTHQGPQSSMTVNSRSDYVEPILISGYSKRALEGDLPADTAATSIWISPASLNVKVPAGGFARLPRTCIVSGSAEMTLDPMRTLRDRMEADMGKNEVAYIESPNSTHDFLTMPWHEPERTNALREVADWLGGVWASI